MNEKIVVAFGGISPEHEVSVLSAMQAIAALSGNDHTVVPLYITKTGRWLTGEYLLELEHYQDLDELESRGISCTFSHNDIGKPVLRELGSGGWFSSPREHPIYALIPAFHGSEGENGSFQGVCEQFNIPYAGSGVFASSLGMDKVKAKELCRAHGVPVVDDVSFFEHEWVEERHSLISRIEEIGYPVIVKPVNLGSSIGVSRAEGRKSLTEAIETNFRYDANLLVEKAVTPLKEINCSVLGDFEDVRSSVCERPLGKEETLSFEDKYQSDSGSSKGGMASADRVIPADIPEEKSKKIRRMSERIFKLFRASGVVRIDFLINNDTGELYFNEINTIPGSFSFYLWEETGLTMPGLMEELVKLARKRHRAKIGRVRSYETNLLSEKAIKGIKGLKGPQQTNG